MTSITTKFATLAVIGATAAGGATIANAATGSSSSSGSSGSAPSGAQAPQGPRDPHKGGHTVGGRTETLLTGSTKAKVQAAALARVKGTVERVETNVDGSAPYEAHIKKADGSEVEVQVAKDFTVAAVNTMGHP